MVGCWPVACIAGENPFGDEERSVPMVEDPHAASGGSAGTGPRTDVAMDFTGVSAGASDAGGDSGGAVSNE